MKTSLTLTLIIAAAIVSFIIASAAVAPNPIVRSFTVNTNPTNYLVASSVRLTPVSWSIDGVTGKPILECMLEAWGDDVDDNGVTNKSVFRRQQFTLTTFQLNNWNTQPGTNGWAWLENLMLSKSKLTKKQ